MTETFASVWGAITDTPEESANMKVRADLMMAIVRRVRGWGVTQQTAARRLGITQPRLSELLGGKITKYSLDAVVSLADRSDLQVKVVAGPDLATKTRKGFIEKVRPHKAGGMIGTSSGKRRSDAMLTATTTKRSTRSRTKKSG
jgi:predicted XRE-type DNA-binding protein